MAWFTIFKHVSNGAGDYGGNTLTVFDGKSTLAAALQAAESARPSSLFKGKSIGRLVAEFKDAPTFASRKRETEALDAIIVEAFRVPPEGDELSDIIPALDAEEKKALAGLGTVADILARRRAKP